MFAQLFYTKPAKAMMYISIPVILVTQYYNFNVTNIILQSLIYMAIAYNAECMIEGGCDMWAWLSIIVPILYSLMYVLYGRRFNLLSTVPSPILQSAGASVGELQKRVNSNEQTNVLPPDGTITESNYNIHGEPVSGSGQPVPTSGTVTEAFSF